MNAKYFEKFMKDLITEDEDQIEGDFLNESSEKKVSKKQHKIL
jgi:hypothetical protein